MCRRVAGNACSAKMVLEAMWELVLSKKECKAIDVRSQKWWGDIEVRTAFQERKDKMLNKLEMSATEVVNWKYITKGQRDHEKRTEVPQGPEVYIASQICERRCPLIRTTVGTSGEEAAHIYIYI